LPYDRLLFNGDDSMSAVMNPIFNLPDVQQFIKLLTVPEVKVVFNMMVENAIALSDLKILKRLTALEVHNGLRDPEDENHPITLPEQLLTLTERIDNIKEPTQELVKPRTTLEQKATELVNHLKAVKPRNKEMFLNSEETMHFMKEGLPEPLRMKDIKNPRQFKRDVIQKAKSMFPFIFLDKKKHGRRDVRIVYKPENDTMRHKCTDTYVRPKPT